MPVFPRALVRPPPSRLAPVLPLRDQSVFERISNAVGRLQEAEEGARLSADEAELLHSRCEELVTLTQRDRVSREALGGFEMN